jgi:hypothetical protein
MDLASAGALRHALLAATGLANSSLRVMIAGLLVSDYRPGPCDLVHARRSPVRVGFMR